jgi:superfamily II DNA or RNA helicase
MVNYIDFLKRKQYRSDKQGFEVETVNPMLFPFQRDIVKWALRKGRAAIFADTGLGKSIMQLSWSWEVHRHTNAPVLILAPLAVAKQTAEDGEKKYNIPVNYAKDQSEVVNGINITNYDRLEKFDTSEFIGVVLDESSILKSFTGKTTNELIGQFSDAPYKLCCTATPSPNDFTEIGTTAEFLGVKRRSEMLSEFFINDITSGVGWRLKGHSESKFYEWIATWGMFIKKPSDLGYDDTGYDLPGLNIQIITVESKTEVGELLPTLAETLTERRQARKDSLDERVNQTLEIINKKPDKQFLIWCDYNYESDALKKSIDNSVEVKGSDTPEHKENSVLGFAHEEIPYLVTKAKIAGFGINWQNCHNMIFCGLSDSFEMFYQAIRRCYRFGQEEVVNVYVIISESEENVLKNIQRKQAQHDEMSQNMQRVMNKYLLAELKEKTIDIKEYQPQQKMIGFGW